MFVNDPNSPYNIKTRREEQEGVTSNVGFIRQAKAEAGEFIIRHGVDVKAYNPKLLSGYASIKKPLSVGLPSAKEYGLKGSMMFALPLAAYRGFSAPRGKAMGNALGGFAGSILGATVGAFFGPVGAIIGAATLSEPIAKVTSNAINMFSSTARRAANLGVGGDYKDTQVAYTMRQRAAQEMGGSLMNARQYLGQEAMLFHE